MDCFNIYHNSDEVAEESARYIASLLRQAVEQRGECHVALPGGSTPAACLQQLAKMQLPWQRVHCYIGDERCLPVGDDERNDVMIERCLWFAVDLPQENRHIIHAELGPEDAARRFADEVRDVVFDVVVLGIGEDGHTASLFPGNAALHSHAPAVAVYDAPKPPPERVSLGLRKIAAARERVVLATGAGKAEAVSRVRAGEQLPVAMIGLSHWFLDQAADGSLVSTA